MDSAAIAAAQTAALPTCCPSHPDLATLTRHLVAEYQLIRSDAVVDAVWRSYSRTHVMALPASDRLRVVEAACRYQFEIVTQCTPTPSQPAQPSGSSD
jgi:hypothetical protein